jgi:hypothetical protein
MSAREPARIHRSCGKNVVLQTASRRSRAFWFCRAALYSASRRRRASSCADAHPAPQRLPRPHRNVDAALVRCGEMKA